MSPPEKHPLIALTWASECLPQTSSTVLVKHSRHGLSFRDKSRSVTFAVFDVWATSSRRSEVVTSHALSPLLEYWASFICPRQSRDLGFVQGVIRRSRRSRGHPWDRPETARELLSEREVVVEAPKNLVSRHRTEQTPWDVSELSSAGCSEEHLTEGRLEMKLRRTSSLDDTSPIQHLPSARRQIDSQAHPEGKFGLFEHPGPSRSSSSMFGFGRRIRRSSLRTPNVSEPRRTSRYRQHVHGSRRIHQRLVESAGVLRSSSPPSAGSIVGSEESFDWRTAWFRTPLRALGRVIDHRAAPKRYSLAWLFLDGSLSRR